MAEKRKPPKGFTDQIIRTSEQAAEMGRKSAEARRKKRDMKQALQLLLELPMREGALDNPETFEDIFSVLDIDHRKDKVKNVTVAEAIVAAQVREAINGNVKAAQLVSKLADMIDTNPSSEDDGFIKALQGTAAKDWSDGDEDPE